jgi:hypothetical protein
MVSQAQAAELQDTIEHQQEPEEDLEEDEGLSGVEDN